MIIGVTSRELDEHMACTKYVNGQVKARFKVKENKIHIHKKALMKLANDNFKSIQEHFRIWTCVNIRFKWTK